MLILHVKTQRQRELKSLAQGLSGGNGVHIHTLMDMDMFTWVPLHRPDLSQGLVYK